MEDTTYSDDIAYMLKKLFIWLSRRVEVEPLLTFVEAKEIGDGYVTLKIVGTNETRHVTLKRGDTCTITHNLDFN